MDGDDDQPTQGKQNSGFSDDDISDIVCVLHPHSSHARREIRRIALENSHHIFGRAEVDGVDGDLYHEDEASRFQMAPPAQGNHVVVLKLSASMKDPLMGFTFGRNPARCDMCFTNDPYRRLSNIHFRIFINEYGVVMLEDQSTNGTIVDGKLLKSKSHNPAETKRMLNSGSRIKILMHEENMDLEFMVRVPDSAARASTGVTVTPGPTGPPTSSPAGPGHEAHTTPRSARQIGHSPTNGALNHAVIPREWDGSDKYNRVGIIGKGAFAVVYRVTSKIDGSPYAAKELDTRNFMKNGILDQKVENEMRIMQRIKHPNIVRYIEHFDWDNRLLIIVMEFISGGDLGKYINAYGPLPEDTVKSVASQLLDAFEYLHENNITHRDVKPDNILVSGVEPFEVKLTDFGLSKMVDSEQTFLRTFCGTLLYCAPEVYTEFTEYDHMGRRNPRIKARRPVGQRYGHAVDVWSLGGVLFYTLTGKPPYPVKSGISYSELLNQIMTTDLNVQPLEKQGISRQGIDFLRLMLQKRPEIRSTVQELRNHPWLGGSYVPLHPAYQESFDEITDDELQADASQLSLEEVHLTRRGPRAVISDLIDDDYMDDEESEKENQTQNPRPAPRLLARSTSPRLGARGAGETIILDSEAGDSFDDSDHFTPNRRSQPKHHAHPSIGPHNQSADQLQSLVHDVQSQSLGRTESVAGGVSLGTRSDSSRLMQPTDFTTSKRKPSHDTSDEFDQLQDRDKPTIKRLKSELDIEGLSEEVMEEYKLIASVPPVQRLESGRQIDRPVHKTVYWDRRDAGTHHVHYPEMTQLQLDVFRQAAREKGQNAEEGGKENAPPPQPTRPQTLLRRDSRKLRDGIADIPSTAPPSMAEFSDGLDSIPDTLPTEGIIVPLQDDPNHNRVVGLIESAPDSAVTNVSLPIADSMMSWGRGPENTHMYEPKTEVRVPKCAFKILLYKEGFDAARDRHPHPWLRAQQDDESFAFYICTKATNGIWVNNQHLLSHDAKKPASPAHHWMRLYNGDQIIVWGSLDADKTKVTPRPVHAGLARRLDEICLKAERRSRSDNMYRQQMDMAVREHSLRERYVESERARSAQFEKKRQMAVAFVNAARLASRKGSPQAAPARQAEGCETNLSFLARRHHPHPAHIGKPTLAARWQLPPPCPSALPLLPFLPSPILSPISTDAQELYS
ncbi:unnamed protein product [Parascedosporium putredinis]|uniref:Autophagy-related protein 1 n=1 Tax=Parascedosporium putredinis TaxID=1442378 RepID=A0A9P1MB39_9PEZI|nr:unnamed protein product [Parascedosporium putredinis]CAI7997967.1 unnamed protein product [Parascedosporium putredinis]